MERCVLAILLLQCGRPVSRDVLAARLWGENLPGRAWGNLSSYISRTRRRLRDAGSDARITLSAQTYTLTTDPDLVDLHRFRRLGRQADAIADSGDTASAVGLLLQAEELWRGEPLAGLPGEWTPGMRRSLEEEHRRTRLKRIELELRLGRHAEIIGELHRLVARYPLDERFAAQLMLALYRSDRQADALAVYRRIQRLLKDTQGADPGAPLQSLQHQILARDGELAITPQHRSRGRGPQPRTLPPSTAHFTGRTRELRILTDTDHRGTRGQAVVIEGMPGVGKTALAVHAAHILADRYPDAQLLLPLRAHDPHHPRLAPAGALAELLTMLGVPAASVPPTPARRAAMWQAEMAGRRAVVVLDDAADGDQVRPLLPAARDCLTIITARNRLKDLDGLRQISLETLSPGESLTLFNRLADTGEGVDEETVTRIVDLCGHLPLAIQLVASQLRGEAGSRPPDVIDDLQAAGFTIPDVGVGGDAVQAAFESSYQRLSPDQRRVFRRLGIGPCPDITPHAAAALDDTTPSDIAPVVDGLVEAHLLQRGPEGRLSFHDLIREYACDRAEREDSSQERRRALGRLLNYYLRSAERADRILDPHRRRTSTAASGPAESLPGPAESLPGPATHEDAHAWMEGEWRNGLRVIEYAIDHEWKTQGLRLAHAMAAFLDTAGQWEQAATIHERALRAARELGDLRHLAQASAELSLARLRTGLSRDALEHARRALDAYRELRDLQAEAESLDHIGVIHWSSGRNREALAYGQEAFALYRRIGDDRGQADSLAHCGIARWHLGRCEEAMDCLRQALALYRRIGDRRGEAKTLNNMGEALRQRGFHREATSLYQESLAIFSRISGRQNRAILKNNLANVLQYKGRYRPAVDAYREALAVFRETGDRKNIADVLNNIGTTYQMMDRHDEALIHHKRARAIAEEIADSFERTWALRGMGDAYQGLGRYQDALDCYQQALAMAREMGDLYQEARVHDGVATVTLHLYGIRAARIRWRQALDLFQALAVPEARSLALRLQALDGMAS